MSSRISSRQSLRCFVGLDFHVPRSVRELVEQFANLDRTVRATPVENLHVTLKFLGHVEAEEIRAVDGAVREAVAGVDPFDFDLVGAGAFPHVERPNVCWIGVERAEPIVQLAAAVEERMQPLGFPPERRAFSPHLTIARVKARPPERLFELLTENAERSFGTVKVDRVVLFESTLDKRGPTYSKIATHELGRGSRV